MIKFKLHIYQLTVFHNNHSVSKYLTRLKDTMTARSTVSTRRAGLCFRVGNLVRVTFTIRIGIPVVIWWRHRCLAHFHPAILYSVDGQEAVVVTNIHA